MESEKCSMQVLMICRMKNKQERKDKKMSTIQEIKKMNDVSAVEENYGEFLRTFSCKPDREKYPYPKLNDVLDEEKSVRWNREEVVRLRAEYEEKVKDMQREKNAFETAYEAQIIKLLAKAYSFTMEESRKIWSYAYGKSHSYGIHNVRMTFEEIADLYDDLLRLRPDKQ